MTTDFTIDSREIYHLQDIKGVMAQKIDALSKASFDGPVIRFEFPLQRQNALDWLNQQTAEKKIYWSDRDEIFEVAGVGSAHMIQGEGDVDYISLCQQARGYLLNNDKVRYYGGFCFDSKNYDQDWADFGTFRLIVPRFELFQTFDQSVFACNIFREAFDREKLLKEVEDLKFGQLNDTEHLPRLVSRLDLPNREKWNETINELLELLQRNVFKKVVSARKSIFEFEQPLNPVTLLKRLKQETPHCYHFCFQPKENITFVGASPERLYKRDGLSLQTEALAGTRPRGETMEEDNILKGELRHSRKDWFEHKIVVDTIKRALAELCHEFKSDPHQSLLQLKGGHHLITRIEGKLNDNICDGLLLERLHPTPAVGGAPREEAMRYINDHEPFARGYYAGPLGYLGANCSEFAVAIRSGLLEGNRLSLYSGAGIVDSSWADYEWREIESKMSIFSKALEL